MTETNELSVEGQDEAKGETRVNSGEKPKKNEYNVGGQDEIQEEARAGSGEKPKKKRHKILRRVLIAIAAVLVCCVVGMGIYFSDYYHADSTALQTVATPSSSVEVYDEGGDTITFVPKGEIKAGLIFYPGAKVETESYAVWANELAGQGVLCVLYRMPLNFALFNTGAAQSAFSAWPQVSSWYIAGHSLGGVAAASYAADNSSLLRGIVFLGSYPNEDMSGLSLKTLSIIAENDGVSTVEEVQSKNGLLSSGYKQDIIKGGCHAYFGNYGQQDGDGTPTIAREEQQSQMCSLITNWIESNE